MTTDITIRPATLERFDDLAVMVGPKKPGSNVCWCLSHRIPSKLNRDLRGLDRREYVRGLCERAVAPGVLAYRDQTVVGWAAVAPRAELPLARSSKYPTIDDLPVWSVICVRVRPGHRGSGISRAVLSGAVDHAFSHGAPAVEGYPVDNQDRKVDLTMAFVGIRAVFESVGFRKVADTDAIAGGFPRVVMRRDRA